MIKQHVRRQKRAEGGILVYVIAAFYFSIIILKTMLQLWIKIAIIIIFIAIAVLIFYVEAKKGTFNKVKMSEKGIEIFKLGNSEVILWKEVTSVRLLCEEYDIKNGLEERYYGIYYIRDNIECKEMISYNMETDRELRKYYKRKT